MALEAQVLEPAARVRKLAEHSAEMIHVDSCVPIKRYFRSGKEMIKMANIYFEEEDWERSFVLYNKYITLFVEKLPQQHPEYNQSRTQDIKESKKTVKGAFPKAEETKLKVKEKYTAEYEKWLSEEDSGNKLGTGRNGRMKKLGWKRRRDGGEEERLQREREAAMGEEERQTLRMERERQSLEEQQRILEQQRAAILEEQRREQLALEEEKRCWNLAGKEQRRIDAEPRNNQTEGDVTGNREPVIAPPRPSAPTVDRSLKIDRSTKPNHLAGSDVSPPLERQTSTASGRS
ncbi:putative STAM-binding protein-like A [Apostichopus japonicus]|uniref:Putative STAM-binding protein-like A n=1 Tax=Stichopus japonicus TaxID=307972 RepID=A0A2G8K1E0_STIJA|nr:putative STAM-binding protein-like A [Apostichopus japonicus]